MNNAVGVIEEEGHNRLKACPNGKRLANKHFIKHCLVTKNLPFGHLVWCCLVVFDKI